MVWVCTICMLFFACYRLLYGESDDKRYYIYEDALGSAGCYVTVQGCADRIEQKTTSYYLYLKDVSVTSNVSRITNTHLPRLILSFSEQPAVLPGYQIQAAGTLCEWDQATNPGQFDARKFYREKGIYYIMYGKKYSIVSHQENPYQTFLMHLRERLCGVIEDALPPKQAGVVTTMLLGDKSGLDLDVRTLYQQNGIGHLLAISGLHITILCMALYRLLLELHLPRSAAVPITAAVLWGYGEMTGFSVSASRAVIMMCLYLFAGLLGRSYDMLSAMACSALITVLQYPFAATSSSFLLSYAAVLGAALIVPVLRECILGDEQMQRRRKRRMHRMEREQKARGWRGVLLWWLVTVREVLLQGLFMSTAVQVTTLPVLLYFYYEVPTYGVILNIVVLPLASFLITLAAFAALSGLFLPILAKFLFAAVSLILSFYETACAFCIHLPMPVVLTGRPSMGRLAGYILCVAAAVWLWQVFRVRRIPLYLWTAGTILLVLPPLMPSFSMTFLDVGQGDGIVIHTPENVTFLIDGGSTSEKQVGEYRIKPFLKYYGISKIDYMIMSHADEDHISGQKELLENQGKPGEIQICNLLLPEPALEYQQEEGYSRMLQLAKKNNVPVRCIHRGDRLTIRDLDLLCLHPDAGFDGGSANAYSTSLSISWKNKHFLLCGDLEKTGEDAVLQQLNSQAAQNPAGIHQNALPEHYDILKVSHHGSKNSSSDAFLQRVNPSLAIISCGEDNRYGHPHTELLKRIGNVQASVLRTDQQGSIRLEFTMRLLLMPQKSIRKSANFP